jgi:hypothetical protein
MGPQRIKIKALGQGTYLTLIHFSMAGLWKIEITAHADGFNTVQQALQLFVQ